MAGLTGSQRDLLALCSLTVANDRCDWGVIARQAHRDRSLDVLLAGEIVESGARADRTAWVVEVKSSDDWAAACERATAEYQAALAAGAHLTTVLDEDYPINLRFVHNLPPFLFYRGRLDADGDARSVAVVGTRSATADGLSKAGRMARLLTEFGITVTSGLALGIDTAAHRSTVDARRGRENNRCAGKRNHSRLPQSEPRPCRHNRQFGWFDRFTVLPHCKCGTLDIRKTQ